MPTNARNKVVHEGEIANYHFPSASASILLPLASAPHPVPLSPQRLPAKDLLKRCAVRGKLAGRGAES